MKAAFLKYLMVIACIVCLLEGAGVPLSAAFGSHTRQSEWQSSTTDDDDATERSEKETNLKEFYADDQLIVPMPQYAILSHANYAREQDCYHLGWIPPVPTPPPNSLA